uniref:hypothetical protein n=1 Tax=Wolbachia endosymbiont of Mansonella ozzardi TaxID=137464 RepID=UPI001CE20A07|nr:hypothetical protein [Wolbachia endosymbiont of Mansonella ozzardi]
MGKEDTLVLPVTDEVINEHINKHTDAHQPYLAQDWSSLSLLSCSQRNLQPFGFSR